MVQVLTVEAGVVGRVCLVEEEPVVSLVQSVGLLVGEVSRFKN